MAYSEKDFFNKPSFESNNVWKPFLKQEFEKNNNW